MKRYYLAALIGLFLIPIALLVPTAYEAWRFRPAQEEQEPSEPSGNPYAHETSPPTRLTLYDGGKPVKVWLVETNVVHPESNVLRFTDSSTGRDVWIYGPAVVTVSYKKQ
jgi:hypothetical protein